MEATPVSSLPCESWELNSAAQAWQLLHLLSHLTAHVYCLRKIVCSRCTLAHFSAVCVRVTYGEPHCHSALRTHVCLPKETGKLGIQRWDNLSKVMELLSLPSRILLRERLYIRNSGCNPGI